MSGGELPRRSLADRELPFLHALARHERRAWLRAVMLGSTRGGDGWALVLLVPLALLAGGTRGLTGVACGVLSGLLTALVVAALKVTVGRRRPHGVELGRPIGAPDDHAFPSGHSAHAFSVLVIAFWIEPWLALVIAPFSCAVAASRMFFGLHYPTDVLAGALIGAASALLSLAAARSLGLVEWIGALV